MKGFQEKGQGKDVGERMQRKGGEERLQGGNSQLWWGEQGEECPFSGVEARALPLLRAPICLCTAEGRQVGPRKRKEEAWFVLRIFFSSVLFPLSISIPPPLGPCISTSKHFPHCLMVAVGEGNKHLKRW